VDKGLLHRLVLKVDGGRPSHRVDLIHLSIIGLFWLPKENVDEGPFTRLGLESGLDKFLNLVVGYFNVHDLFLTLGAGEPEDVFGTKGNGVGVDPFTDKLEPAWRYFLTLAFDLEVPSGSTPTATTTPTSESSKGLLLLR